MSLPEDCIQLSVWIATHRSRSVCLRKMARCSWWAMLPAATGHWAASPHARSYVAGLQFGTDQAGYGYRRRLRVRQSLTAASAACRFYGAEPGSGLFSGRDTTAIGREGQLTISWRGDDAEAGPLGCWRLPGNPYNHRGAQHMKRGHAKILELVPTSRSGGTKVGAKGDRLISSEYSGNMLR